MKNSDQTVESEFICGGCAAIFSTRQALCRHWYHKKKHTGLVFVRSKRRRIRDAAVEQYQDEPNLERAECDPIPPVYELFRAIPREPANALLENDVVDLDAPTYDPGVGLSLVTKELLPIIAKLNRDDGAVLVRNLSKQGLIPWTNLKEVNSFLDRHANWTKKEVEVNNGNKIYVECVEDPTIVFNKLLFSNKDHLQLVSRPEFVVDTAGNKVREYTSFCNGILIQKLQEEVLNPSSLRDSLVLPYGLYSDGSELRGNARPFHPVYIFLTCLPPSHVRRHDNYECIGMLPDLTWHQMGFPENMTSSELIRAKHIKRGVRQECLKAILCPFKNLMKGGMEGSVNNKPVMLMPTPTHWVRDLKEGAEIMGMVESFKANTSCLLFTTSTPQDLCDSEMSYKPRTENQMEQVRHKSREYDDQGRIEESISLLKRFGLSTNVKIAMSGWGCGVDSAAMFSYPDRLHQCSLGILKILKDLIGKVLTPDEFKRVNAEVCSAPTFPSCRRPARGLLSPKFEGKEVYYTMIFVPVALLALTKCRAAGDNVVLNLLDAIMGYQEWCRIRDLDVHTDETLEILEEKRKRFQSLVMQHFNEHCNWARPKFAEMAAYPATIKALGNVSYADTSTGEAMHKEQKQFSSSQNNQSSAVSQVTMKRNRVTTAVHIQNSDSSIQQKTRVTTADNAHNKCEVLLHSIGNVYECSSAGIRKLMSDTPQLQAHEAGDQLLACMKCVVESSNPNVSGDIMNEAKIGVANRIAIPCRVHRGAGLQVQYVKVTSSDGHHPTVSINAGDGEEWYGQIRLAFALNIKGLDSIELLYVRRYRECHGRRNRYKDHLAMPRCVWDSVRRRGKHSPVYQCVPLACINRLVVMQRDPSSDASEEAFFNNTLVPLHYVDS